ncbi:MAG: ABC transporter ATP-binding protein [Ruminococcaceae bacterium]|nr:ABC transporter ATP-binding protein [Oscillospiraceae bacterium]
MSLKDVKPQVGDKTAEGKLVTLTNICKSFDNEEILKNVNLYIKDKTFVTLLGPSGCGKTTILRIIGGFETPSSGEVYFGDTIMNDVPPHKRPVNTVFQKYALFPHLNVFENIAFGLRIKKLPEAEIKAAVKKMLALVDLKGYERRPINKLSGGQQQRVAIARALVNMPKLLLLDEPLGALDLKLRKDMQLELKKIQQQANITFIYVTHDQEEALTMSDIIVVMKSGKIQQIGTPQDIYNEPANAFVADFIGESNIIDAVMTENKKVTFCGHEFDCVDDRFEDTTLVDVVVRPEDVDVTSPENGMVCGVVEDSVFKGVHYEMTVKCGEYYWLIHSTDSQPVGATIGMSLDPDCIHIMRKMFPTTETHIDIDEFTVEDGKVTFTLEDSEFTVDDASVSEDDSLSAVFEPFDIQITAENEGDFNGYLDSVIYKSYYNEMIVITDNNRWLVKSYSDEQVGTTVGVKINPQAIRLEKKEAAQNEV